MKIKQKKYERFTRSDTEATRILFHIADHPGALNYQRCKVCLERISGPGLTYFEPGAAIYTAYNKKGLVIIRIAQNSSRMTPDIWAKARFCKEMEIQ